MTRILLCLSHSIEEHDQLRLLHDLGYEVASIGGYIDPANPHDPKRPPLDIPCVEQVKRAVDALGVDDNLGVAQSRIPNEILDWLGDSGVIIYHHYLDRLFGQWENHLGPWLARSSSRRIVWRTVGQSVEHNELQAQPFRARGLEIVRYSPKERAIPGFAGEDALIRFWKDPDEWDGWRGDTRVVANVTQRLLQRQQWTNFRFWEIATEGLPTSPAGPGSEELPNGQGELPFEVMRGVLRMAAVYLYTGTQPASYTLGLIEALMTGIPVVSIGPDWMDVFGGELFEGHELALLSSNDPSVARQLLAWLLDDVAAAREISSVQRQRALQLFSKSRVGQDWLRFLGAP